MSPMRNLSVLLFAFAAVAVGPALAADPDWSQVGQALGKLGTVQAGAVYRVAFPRTDLEVTLDHVKLQTGFASTGWIAFMPVGHGTMVMGDLVLTQDEVKPVMQKLEAGGISVTALHNHLLRVEPMILFMHIEGHGDAIKLARAVQAGIAEGKTPFTPLPGSSQPTDIDMIGIDRILGYRGKDNSGVYQFGVPRRMPVNAGDMPLPAPMGTATAITFQPTGFDTAAVTGDFVLTSSEVDPVIRVLLDNGIEVTALHSHMLDEEPRLFFLHFRATDSTLKLAKGLRAALDKVDVKRMQ